MALMHDADEELLEQARWLEACRPLWAERPFIGLPVAWEAELPEVAAALRALPVEAIEAVESRPWELPSMPEPWPSWVAEAARWSSLPELPRRVEAAFDEPPLRVLERKWRQIRPFLEAVLAAPGASRVERWLEWCSGKGHLGRAISLVTERPLVCVERDADLCYQGDQEAIAAGLDDSRFIEADLLRADLASELGEGTGALALHACGGLHRELIRQGISGGATLVALAPCCYHRFLEPLEISGVPEVAGTYEARSAAGRRAGISLEAGHLKLIGLSEAVATPRRQVLRRREQAYRLGLDLLLREVTGEDRYRPLGPAPRRWVERPFADFARRLAERHGLELPEGLRHETYRRLGEERLRLVRALGLVRGLFRRPLETWLLRDLTCALTEAGYETRLGRFCPASASPRNAMILAWRNSGPL